MSSMLLMVQPPNIFRNPGWNPHLLMVQASFPKPSQLSMVWGGLVRPPQVGQWALLGAPRTGWWFGHKPKGEKTNKPKGIFCWIYWGLLGFIGLFIFLGLLGFIGVLFGFIGIYWDLLGFIWIYWDLRGSILMGVPHSWAGWFISGKISFINRW